VTESEYNSIDAIRHSRLKTMGTSPLHYRHACDTERADTAAFAFGRAVHCAVLEPLAFTGRYVLWDGGRRAGKTWEAFKAATPDHDILTATEWNDCMAMSEAVHAHPVASKLLATGESEATLQWQDAETGLAMKCRCDWMRHKPAIVVDLKTTQDASAEAFAKSVARYGYASQAAFYCDGYATLSGSMPFFAFIVVEKSAPFDVCVHELDDEALAHGRRQYRSWLHRVAECRASGEWPGRSDDIQVLQLPAWATRG